MTETPPTNDARHGDQAPSAATVANIDAVSRLEAAATQNRSRAERIADVIAAFVGSPGFLALQVAVCVVWVALNLGVIPIGGVRLRPFDPYPFALLALVISLEAVLMSVFVLIKQNRMGRRSDERAHLGLQIGILTEQESTKTLALVEKIALRMGVEADDPLIAELRRETKIEHLANVVKQAMPQD
jgi:uncharacterized membrane protein